MLETCIFFVHDHRRLERIAQHTYADVVTGKRAMPRLAGRRVRVADWYVERAVDGPGGVRNETYTILSFDEVGRALPVPDCCWLPTGQERQAMLASLGFMVARDQAP